MLQVFHMDQKQNADDGSSYGSVDGYDSVTVGTIVPDTGVIIDGYLSECIAEGLYRSPSGLLHIVIPEAVPAELEHQADARRDSGFRGLDELAALQQMAEDGLITISFAGERPGPEEIRYASSGAIDDMIRRVALMHEDSLLITTDKVQSLTAKAYGIRTELIEPVIRSPAYEDLAVHRFFDQSTMSVHLKCGLCPSAKRGSVGRMKYETIRSSVCTRSELDAVRKELRDFAETDPGSYVEIEREGALVLQIRDMRTAVTTKPFSDDTEITIVRPIASVDFDRYDAGDMLRKRILGQRGILIAGSPGAGKSTFAASVAKFLLENGNVVKTMESPRDLQVPPGITQYAPLDGEMENTADILLLVRPDYTVYDEVRKTKDFMIFADMRLAGVGMIGVVHATRAIDAVQRLIGRIELGIIPQVVDTVIYIDKGMIAKVYALEFKVKVPYGMTEEDLTRPVIVVSDLKTGKSEYEIYTYGEQVVVMPVGLPADVRKPEWDLAEKEIGSVISRYVRGPFEVEMITDRKAVVLVSPSEKRMIIGRNGDTISNIEASLGMRIDVRELSRAAIRRESRRMKTEARMRNASYRAGHGTDDINGERTGSTDDHGTDDVDVYGRDSSDVYGTDAGNGYGVGDGDGTDDSVQTDPDTSGRFRKPVTIRPGKIGKASGSAGIVSSGAPRERPSSPFASGWVRETPYGTLPADDSGYAVPTVRKTKKHLILEIEEYAGEDVDVFSGNEHVFSATVSPAGTVRIRIDSEAAEEIRNGFASGEIITVKRSEY